MDKIESAFVPSHLSFFLWVLGEKPVFCPRTSPYIVLWSNQELPVSIYISGFLIIALKKIHVYTCVCMFDTYSVHLFEMKLWLINFVPLGNFPKLFSLVTVQIILLRKYMTIYVTSLSWCTFRLSLAFYYHKNTTHCSPCLASFTHVQVPKLFV